MKRLLAWLLMLGLSACLAARDDARQAEDADDEDAPDEMIEGKAALTIANVGHVGVIAGMAFTPDGRTLITVGHDHTIQEYDAASGERRRVVHPPAGRTVGDRLNGVGLLGGLGKEDAGNVLAVIGTGIRAATEGGGRHQRLFLYDRKAGKIASTSVEGLKTGGGKGLEALACSPTAPTTATASGDSVQIHQGVDQLLENPKAEARKPSATLKVPGTRVRSLAFSPNGKRLAAAVTDKTAGHVLVWTVSKKDPPKLVEDHQLKNHAALGLAWLPSGEKFLTTHHARAKQAPLQLWSKKGKPLLKKTFTRAQLSRFIKDRTIDVHQVVLRSEDEALLTLTWTGGGASTANHLVLSLDLSTGESRELLYQENITTPHPGAEEALIPLALSPDRNLLAVAVEPRGSRIAWIDLTRKEKVRFSGETHGLRSPIAWTKDGTTIAWHARDENTHIGLNLKTLTAQSMRGKRDLFGPVEKRTDGWKVDRMGAPGRYYLRVRRKGKDVARAGKRLTLGDPFTLSPAGTKPWLAWSARTNLFIGDPATGKVRHHLRPFKTRILSLAPSPDGRYLAAASSRELLYIYRISGSEKVLQPLLTVYTREQEWIAWTRQGYYAATPGGERLIGWTINNGLSKPATFHPARRFRNQLYRPELIPLVLEKGDLKAALAALPPPKKETGQTRSADLKVDDLLPPTVEIVSIDESKKPTVTIKVKAKRSAAGQPVKSLRLMVNGRPLPEAKYLKDLGEKGKAEHEETWTLEVAQGKTELSVLARSRDALAVSETKVINYMKGPTSRLFALCVGVNQYKNAKLNLKAACNDATGIAEALKKHCAKAPLFALGEVAKPLLDAKATKKEVLDALAALRAKGGIKPTDLVVLFFAGHGVKDKQDFYLLTHEADVKDFKSSCISGSELRKALSVFPCQVLLLLDACHSGAVGGALNARPAADEATRTLTDEEVGVVVLSAAMDHEHALEKDNHGYFAAALIDGMARAQGVSYNFHDKHVYIHHLFGYAFDRVKVQSVDRQHPSLNLPSTVESFALVP
jgi:WD40 repeat protein